MGGLLFLETEGDKSVSCEVATHGWLLGNGGETPVLIHERTYCRVYPFWYFYPFFTLFSIRFTWAQPFWGTVSRYMDMEWKV